MTEQKKQIYLYPISPTAFQTLRHGDGVVMEHYAVPLHPDKMLFIVLWNKTRLGFLDRTKFNNMRKAGIDVANVGLTEQELDKLENTQDGTTAVFGPFDVLLMSQTTHESIQNVALNRGKMQ
jgi:hypothetical protein